MPQPLLFDIYINDTDRNIFSPVHKLADDTKLHSNVCTCDQTDHLQCDSDKMSKWSTIWQMLFNADKCKCLHLGHSYHRINYSIGVAEIKNVKAEKYLHVTIGCTLDSSLHCAKAVSTAVSSLSSREHMCIRVKAILCICISHL